MTLIKDVLLQNEVQEWIGAHLKDDIYTLALKPSPFDLVSMKDLVQQIQGRKIAAKKFSALDRKFILFPPKLNLEQTSSQITACYKSNIISGSRVMDVTGGLGIDCIGFAHKFKTVYHIEQNATLQFIASHNFEVLSLTQIKSFHADGIEFLRNFEEPLDVIYIDPSRRDASSKKVFLLEDLQPNILDHFSDVMSKAATLLIKLSPLIDIQYLVQTIPNIYEIHIVAVKNEVKEVLVKVNSHSSDDIAIIAVNLETNQKELKYSLADEIDYIGMGTIQKFIYEPNAAIQKSGGGNILGSQYNLKKLHPNTQLYTSDTLKSGFPGRTFEVLHSIKNPKKELKNRSIMAIHRNFPMKLNDLKKKYKFTTDGTDAVLFTQDIERKIIKQLQLVE